MMMMMMMMMKARTVMLIIAMMNKVDMMVRIRFTTVRNPAITRVSHFARDQPSKKGDRGDHVTF